MIADVGLYLPTRMFAGDMPEQIFYYLLMTGLYLDDPQPTNSQVIFRADQPVNGADMVNGRFCVKTGYWVPGHRVKYVDGRPYLDTVAPVQTVYDPPDPPEDM